MSIKTKPTAKKKEWKETSRNFNQAISNKYKPFILNDLLLLLYPITKNLFIEIYK